MPILQTTEIFRRSKAVVVEAICCDFFPQILLAPVFKKELQIYSLKKKKTTHRTTQKCEHHHLSWCPGNNHENHPQEPHHYPATPKSHRGLRRSRQLPLVATGKSLHGVHHAVCIFVERKEIEIRDFGGNFGF